MKDEIGQVIKERIRVAIKPKQEICQQCPHFNLSYPREKYNQSLLAWDTIEARCAKSYMFLPRGSMVFAFNKLGYYIMQPAIEDANKVAQYVKAHGVYRQNKKAFVPDSCPYKLEHILETKS